MLHGSEPSIAAAPTSIGLPGAQPVGTLPWPSQGENTNIRLSQKTVSAHHLQVLSQRPTALVRFTLPSPRQLEGAQPLGHQLLPSLPMAQLPGSRIASLSCLPFPQISSTTSAGCTEDSRGHRKEGCLQLEAVTTPQLPDS